MLFGVSVLFFSLSSIEFMSFMNEYNSLCFEQLIFYFCVCVFIVFFAYLSKLEIKMHHETMSR